MPLRQILSDQEGDNLLALRENQQDLIQVFAFNEYDLSVINKGRVTPNQMDLSLRVKVIY